MDVPYLPAPPSAPSPTYAPFVQVVQGLSVKDSSLRTVLPESEAKLVTGLPRKGGGVVSLLHWLRLVSWCILLRVLPRPL